MSIRHLVLLALFGTFLGAGVALATAPPPRITHGLFQVLPNGDVTYELCGAVFNADGGVKYRPPCAQCTGWKNWNTCEAKWRADNELPPR